MGREQGRRVIAQCTVRPYLIIILTPAFELVTHVGEGEEDFAFIAQPPIERFDEGIPHRFAGTDEIQLHAVTIRPNPKPFTWTKDPNKIIAAIKPGHQVLD